jgi:chromosome segregation ATPase
MGDEVMKFQAITYQRIKNLGNYESERIEISAELEDGDDKDEAMAQLRSWVGRQLSLRAEVQDLRDQKRDLRLKLEETKSTIERVRNSAISAWEKAEQQWMGAKTVLESHGIQPEAELPKLDFSEIDDIPF